MMQIAIDRDKRLLLLKWLKQGYIDSVELGDLKQESPITADEIEAELRRLAFVTLGEDCQRLQDMGFCPYCKSGRASTPASSNKR